jgi:hypothetical protein
LLPAFSLIVVCTAAGRSDILTVSSFSSAAVKKTGQAKLPITAIDIAAIVFFIDFSFDLLGLFVAL